MTMYLELLANSLKCREREKYQNGRHNALETPRQGQALENEKEWNAAKKHGMSKGQGRHSTRARRIPNRFDAPANVQQPAEATFHLGFTFSSFTSGNIPTEERIRPTTQANRVRTTPIQSFFISAILGVKSRQKKLKFNQNIKKKEITAS